MWVWLSDPCGRLLGGEVIRRGLMSRCRDKFSHVAGSYEACATIGGSIGLDTARLTIAAEPMFKPNYGIDSLDAGNIRALGIEQSIGVLGRGLEQMQMHDKRVQIRM